MSETDVKAQGAPEEAVIDPAMREMMDAGVFYGRTRNKTNPKMKQFVIANRNGVEIINLEKSKEQMESAVNFLKNAASKNISMIIAATQPSAHEAALTIGKEFGLPVVTRRWLGGTLTNYRVIAKRVEYFKKLKVDLAQGAFKAYTKKEQLDLEKETAKLDETLSGLENMVNRPEVLIVIDPVVNRTAVAEANRLGIPIVAFTNTDADPTLIDHAVLGNTKARTAISWFLSGIKEGIKEGKREAAAAKAAPAAEVK